MNTVATSPVEMVMALPYTVEEAVQNGVAILDERSLDWADGIDTMSLKMSNGDCCVLGLLFGGYEYGCDRLGLTGDTPARCGFNIFTDDEEPISEDAWRPLQAEWVRVITERQS